MDGERTFFEAQIDASSIKVFTAALQLLHKVGKEVVFEVKADLFALRALNDLKSSFALVEFVPNFFDSLVIEDEEFPCKLPAKPLTMIMRNMKNLRTLTIRAFRREEEHLVSFQFLLKNDIIRKYNFCYEDSEIMNALFDEQECSLVQMPPKLMSQLLDHIHRSPEILVTAQPNRFTVRSQHKPAMLKEVDLQKSVMTTGLTMGVSEFQEYQYQSARDTESIIFVVKEVVAFVGFCETLDLSTFSFYFSTGGRPVRFQTNQEFYQASLTMATMPSVTDNLVEEEQEEAEAEYKINNPYNQSSRNQQDRDEEGVDGSELLTAARLQQQQQEMQSQSTFLMGQSPAQQNAQVAMSDEVQSESTVMQGASVPKEVAVIRKINRKRQFLEGTQEGDEG